MALSSFKNFLKANRETDKIKLAASLIESRRFPIKAFAEWYANYGAYYPSNKYPKVLKEAWSDYGQAALTGGLAGAGAGALSGGGIGALPGAAIGALGGLAHQAGKDVYNWATSGPWSKDAGKQSKFYIDKFTATAKQAEETLNQLKQLSSKLVELKVTGSDNFGATIDTLISQLKSMTPGQSNNQPTQQNPASGTGGKGGGMARQIPEQEVDEVENKLKDDPSYQHLINKGIFKYIIDNAEQLSQMPGEVKIDEEKIRSALAHYMVEKGDTDPRRAVNEFLEEFASQADGIHKPFDEEGFDEFLKYMEMDKSALDNNQLEEAVAFNSLVIASRINMLSRGTMMTHDQAVKMVKSWIQSAAAYESK